MIDPWLVDLVAMKGILVRGALVAAEWLVMRSRAEAAHTKETEQHAHHQHDQPLLAIQGVHPLHQSPGCIVHVRHGIIAAFKNALKTLGYE
jgi:hypothetical protein